MSATTYPVRVDARLDAPLSRWLWAVKWLLAIPHYFVLAFLWLAFVALSAVAFFAILFTGRYPRAIFDFNVGVLRWTWRVQYYAYGALGTDKYPPFSLEEDPTYPANLAVQYPERLSRGLVLVKWWLLAIPHYIIVGIFAGGGALAATRLGDQHFNWTGGGLIGILVLIAAVILAITGRYPDPIFGFVLGMNRWVLRVAAYAGLMTDEYPPFRLDAGGADPGSITMFGSGQGSGHGAPPSAMTMTDRADQISGQEPAPPRPSSSAWTGGRIAGVVLGSLLAAGGAVFLAGGATLLAVDHGYRQAGYITSPSAAYRTNGYALVSDNTQIPRGGWHPLATDVVGKVRIRVTAADPSRPVFVGLARASQVRNYLAGVRYTTVHNPGSATTLITRTGGRVPAAPATMPIWAASASGRGTQALVWTIPAGNWVVVAMNPDAAAGLAVRADIGATVPAAPWIEGGMLAAGVLVVGAGVLLIALTVPRRDPRSEKGERGHG